MTNIQEALAILALPTPQTSEERDLRSKAAKVLLERMGESLPAQDAALTTADTEQIEQATAQSGKSWMDEFVRETIAMADAHIHGRVHVVGQTHAGPIDPPALMILANAYRTFVQEQGAKVKQLEDDLEIFKSGIKMCRDITECPPEAQLSGHLKSLMNDYQVRKDDNEDLKQLTKCPSSMLLYTHIQSLMGKLEDTEKQRKDGERLDNLQDFINANYYRFITFPQGMSVREALDRPVEEWIKSVGENEQKQAQRAEQLIQDLRRITGCPQEQTLLDHISQMMEQHRQVRHERDDFRGLFPTPTAMRSAAKDVKRLDKLEEMLAKYPGKAIMFPEHGQLRSILSAPQALEQFVVFLYNEEPTHKLTLQPLAANAGRGVCSCGWRSRVADEVGYTSDDIRTDWQAHCQNTVETLRRRLEELSECPPDSPLETWVQTLAKANHAFDEENGKLQADHERMEFLDAGCCDLTERRVKNVTADARWQIAYGEPPYCSVHFGASPREAIDNAQEAHPLKKSCNCDREAGEGCDSCPDTQLHCARKEKPADEQPANDPPAVS